MWEKTRQQNKWNLKSENVTKTKNQRNQEPDAQEAQEAERLMNSTEDPHKSNGEHVYFGGKK